MKTKLTLFATVLAAALFGVGCASVATPQTYHSANLVEKNGVLHHTDTNKPVNGRVVTMVNSYLKQEFIVKNGIKNGYFRSWHRPDCPNVVAIYKDGKLKIFREWYTNQEQMGLGPNSPWNRDGTPKNR